VKLIETAEVELGSRTWLDIDLGLSFTMDNYQYNPSVEGLRNLEYPMLKGSKFRAS
jgi:hypothetical protein